MHSPPVFGCGVLHVLQIVPSRKRHVEVLERNPAIVDADLQNKQIS